MRIGPFVTGVAVGLATIGWLMSCGKSPASSLGPTTPGANGSRRVDRFEISGPPAVAPGEARQFTSTVRFRDGSTRDVTSEVRWQSRNDIVSVSPGGVVTGVRVGDGMLTAVYSAADSSYTSTKEVIVVPSGTYRLTGLVSESDSPSAPVPNVRLDVAEGIGAGQSALTGNDGRYRLYGVGGDFRIRISKDGYEAIEQNLMVQDHGSQNFQLKLSRPRLDVGGRYQLTIEAADSCRSQLPEEVWRRVYTAVITQQAALLDVTLSDGTFAVNRSGSGNHFRGVAESEQVRLTLNLTPYYNYYPYVPVYYPDIVEQLSEGYLVMSGSAVLRGSSGNLVGPLDGFLATWPHDPRSGRSQSPTSSCSAASHQVVLKR